MLWDFRARGCQELGGVKEASRRRRWGSGARPGRRRQRLDLWLHGRMMRQRMQGKVTPWDLLFPLLVCPWF